MTFQSKLIANPRTFVFSATFREKNELFKLHLFSISSSLSGPFHDFASCQIMTYGQMFAYSMYEKWNAIVVFLLCVLFMSSYVKSSGKNQQWPLIIKLCWVGLAELSWAGLQHGTVRQTHSLLCKNERWRIIHKHKCMLFMHVNIHPAT